MVLESALIKAIGGTVGTIPFEVAAPLEHTLPTRARLSGRTKKWRKMARIVDSN